MKPLTRDQEAQAHRYVADCAGHGDDASVERLCSLLGLSYSDVGERGRFLLLGLLQSSAEDLAVCDYCGGGPRSLCCNHCDEDGHTSMPVRCVLDAADAWVGSNDDVAAE